MESPHEDRTISRLHALGAEPVDPDVAARHQAYLAAATPAPSARGRMRPLLAGSLLAGALLGGTGLAAALPGSLPEQAGSVAKAALQAVQLVDDDDEATSEEEREAKEAKEAKEGTGVERFLEGCTAGDPPTAFTGNHGQYVKAHPDDPATADVNERQEAAQSDCGKPLSSLGEDDDSLEATEEGDDSDEAKLTGKARADQAKADAEANGRPADAGRPESPGNSEGPKPPTTAANEQGSESRATDRGNSSDAGSSADKRPEGVGPPTTVG